MEKNSIHELRQELAREEERVDKAKGKRCIITILLIGAVFFLLAIKANEINNLLEFILTLIACVFGAGIYFFVNSLIFTPLFTMAQSDNARIERMKKEIAELEKQERNDK